ncbi:MAG TPA: hypothetical protein VJV22_11870, partial [Acidobacteriaceae bacterium]|nr:hypothetical protein [Acidobacteriaceae bacterium]
MTSTPWHQRTLALTICALLISPAGFAQNQTQTPPPPPPETAPAAPPANQQPTPEAPAPPAANQQPSPNLAQQIQQEQQQPIAPPQPFYVALPHSHNPLAPYRPSTAPPLNLHNSPRLQNLIR